MPTGKGNHPGTYGPTYKGSASPPSMGVPNNKPLSKDIIEHRESTPEGKPWNLGKGMFLPPKPKDDPTMFKYEGDEKYMRRAADSLSSRTTKLQGILADPGPGYGKSKAKK